MWATVTPSGTFISHFASHSVDNTKVRGKWLLLLITSTWNEYEFWSHLVQPIYLNVIKICSSLHNMSWCTYKGLCQLIGITSFWLVGIAWNCFWAVHSYHVHFTGATKQIYELTSQTVEFMRPTCAHHDNFCCPGAQLVQWGEPLLWYAGAAGFGAFSALDVPH